MKIETVDDLIEQLEVIRAELARDTSSARYQRIGWADRPLRQLIDQCRQEQESQSWQETRCREHARRVLSEVAS